MNQLFEKYGLEKVNVDSIVEMAGVSKVSFYVHFDSKNSLIAALITDYVNKVAAIIFASYFPQI